MDLRSTLASQSYQSAITVAVPTPNAAEEKGSIAQFATEFMDSLREGEATVQGGLTGGADAHSVVEALAATELAVETAVTVRNKVVEAYQEILRMPV